MLMLPLIFVKVWYFKVEANLCRFFLWFDLLGGELGWKWGSPDTILEGGHPRTIPPKFGCNWPSGF
jgi:hypothetical protein